jgi:TRAP-type mannitol/chloroaromatic compound transport system permease small subunit
MPAFNPQGGVSSLWIAVIIGLVSAAKEAEMDLKKTDVITAANTAIYKGASLLIYPLFIVVSFEVVMRYIFKSPTIFAYDATLLIFGTFTFLGGGYALAKNAHVRADVVSNMLPAKVKNIIHVCCYLVFFFPLLGTLCYSFVDYVAKSIAMGERSPFTIWAPIIWPFKLILGISFFMLLLQGIVEFIKLLKEIFKKKEGVE